MRGYKVVGGWEMTNGIEGGVQVMMMAGVVVFRMKGKKKGPLHFPFEK